jgi:hypothetical protein
LDFHHHRQIWQLDRKKNGVPAKRRVETMKKMNSKDGIRRGAIVLPGMMKVDRLVHPARRKAMAKLAEATDRDATIDMAARDVGAVEVADAAGTEVVMAVAIAAPSAAEGPAVDTKAKNADGGMNDPLAAKSDLKIGRPVAKLSANRWKRRMPILAARAKMLLDR